MKPSERLWTALAIGLGTSVLMWTLGFFGRIPSAPVPGRVLLPWLLLVVLLGGARAGRVPGGGASLGALAGMVASLVNLLVLGSVLAGGERSGAAVWVPTSLAAGLVLGGLGGVLGTKLRPTALDPTSALARVAALATLLLIVLGGLVTSQDAGLAVVDWPNSFGSPMFLFPLAKMVGGIYYEHSHRLFGTLVGLATLVLAIRLLATESRGGVKAMGLGAVAFVIVQGVLGGLRVTGHFTMSASPDATRPSLALAMVHGASAQIFFAYMVALVAVTSHAWRTAPRPEGPPADASSDRTVAWVLVAALLLQLLLGIRVRHLGEGVMAHMTFAVIVLLLAVAAGVRTIAKHRGIPVLRKTGSALLGHVGTQFLLGIVALVALGRAREHGPGAFDVVAATAHQTVGALLLANAALLALWCGRLLPASAETSAPAEPSRTAASRS